MKKHNKFRLLPLTLAIATAINSYAVIAEEEQVDNTEIIQVTGIRSSLTESLENKKNASSIQDSIVAEDIGKFPDQNVAESLQRISGVMISRTNGEGSKVTVRGMGPKFNAVKVNNRTIATTDRGREFDFQALPSELISGADVIKASRANIAEGSLGAYINVNTARPLNSSGFNAVGSLDAVYNDLTGDYDPKGSAIISNTFLDNTIGVLFGYTQLSTTNRIDAAGTTHWSSFQADNKSVAPGPITDEVGNNIEEGTIWYPGRATYTIDTEKRKRTSTNLTLQWAPNNDTTHTFDALYSDLSRQALSNGMQVPLHFSGWEDVIVSENMTALKATKSASPIDGLFQERGQDSHTIALGLNSIYFVDKWTISTDISYSKASADQRGNTLVTNFVNNNVDQSVKPGDEGYQPDQQNGFIVGQDYIEFDSRNGDVIDISSTIDYADPASVRTHWNDIQHNEVEDEILELKLDANYEVDNGFISSVDFGLAYTDREKSQAFYGIDGCGATVSTCGNFLDLEDSLFAINDTSDFLSDVKGDIPREFVLINNINDYKNSIGEIRGEPNWTQEILRPERSVANTEEILAAYGQLNLVGEFDSFSWSGNIGLRYVDTQNSSSGHSIERLSLIEKPVQDGGGLALEAEYSDPAVIQVTTDYQKWLPSFNINMDFGSGFFIKAAAAKVIARPALEDTGVNKVYQQNPRAGDLATSGGNPYLNPYEANQFDTSFEYYDESGNAYSLGLFYKDITNFISTQTTSVDTGLVLDGWGSVYEAITQKSNRSGGSVSGFELAGLHYFDYLPGWLSGFGVQANYTFTSSKDDDATEFERPNVQSPSSGLEGFSENSYNIIGFYEVDGFQVRAAYNWREGFLAYRSGPRIGSNGLPQHTDDYGQVDLSTSYDINEKLTISAEIINATNANILEYADVRERVTTLQYTGRRYQIGITAKF
ncbi:TonB-dependent receptor [Colwellia sp. 1_MG-2023]|uniref:TonB-dependent receptor n=1 Tax=unclassified Colwellia TaxID=196834 RepID=UPI001C0891CC|nr:MULTISPECIES: TonB-dependent receptor [unclassified Colwellia]MBU2924834.1 TonB-dependent receptor [Colwellia sp. C2M11]MDO6654068.1 TonB-dependent receptor [Colwellia sp. 3_MG-2023]MDO6665486.1 TonB-dependent receptor [Colwellia sp. 2_MG-2023]MDO6689755.1 TonB-dependent receptor [Colwellia sp. 1_MG-2023]